MSFNGSFLFREVAPDESLITACYAVFKELLCQDCLRCLVLSDNHQTCCVLVDTMYEIAETVFHLLISILEMISESIKKSSVEVAMTWMYDETCLLIDDDDIIVFIYNIQRNIFRSDDDFTRRK